VAENAAAHGAASGVVLEIHRVFLRPPSYPRRARDAFPATPSVGKVLQRVVADERKRVDVFANLERIGVDEISYKKGHCYLTVVVNHATGRLVWAGPGRDGDTLRRFFDELGPERTARIKLVSADAASWIIGVVRERCPTATQTMDPFHVVQWATRALDQCRRDVWNELRGRGELEEARNYKRSMWVLRKNPEHLSSA